MTFGVVVRNRCTTPVRLAVSTASDDSLASLASPAIVYPGEAIAAKVRADGYLRLVDAPHTPGVPIVAGGTMTVVGERCDQIGSVDWTWP